jgi:AcrR family transcriptional regulator
VQWTARRRIENDRARILCAAARIAAARGYARLSPARIAREAGVSERRYAELFGSTEQCFLEALDRLGLEALVCAAGAARSSADPVLGVHRGIVALMRHVADDPVLVRVAFVEVFALGRPGIERGERLLGQFTELLAKSLPSRGATIPPPGAFPDLALEASVGAIWGIVHDLLTRGAARRLPELAGYASYLALAPAIGGEAAVEVIRSADCV